jgi:hypothetical protein
MKRILLASFVSLAVAYRSPNWDPSSRGAMKMIFVVLGILTLLTSAAWGQITKKECDIEMNTYAKVARTGLDEKQQRQLFNYGVTGISRKDVAKGQVDGHVGRGTATREGVVIGLANGPLSVHNLIDSYNALSACAMFHTPPQSFIMDTDYWFAAREYLDAVSMRESHFLGRHPELEDKFYDEDSAGKR